MVAARTWRVSRMPLTLGLSAGTSPTRWVITSIDLLYLPDQFGFRFSAKATGPSMASAEPKTSGTAALLISQPCASGSSPACFITRLDARTANGAVSYTHLRAHETVLDLVC